MGKVLFGLIAYIPWLAWMIGFHIYKKIRRGEVWESDVFIPVNVDSYYIRSVFIPNSTVFVLRK